MIETSATMDEARPCHKKILIVDDEQGLAKNLKTYLGGAGADIVIAHSGEQAIHASEAFDPDFAIVDFNLPGINGLDTVTEILKKHPETAFLVITGNPSESVRTATENPKIRKVLTKPFALTELANYICGDRPQCAACSGVAALRATLSKRPSGSD